MHLASSSKVERLVDVSAKLLKEGYDAGYRQGRVKGFSVGIGAGFLLAIALWMGMAMVAANAEERDDTRSLMQWASDYTGLPMPDTTPEIRMVPPQFFKDTICQAVDHCEAQGWSPGPEVAERFGAESGVVYLDYTLDTEADPYARALLVHELVHHLQREAGAFGTVVSRNCVAFIQRESQAVLTQRAWLYQHGIGDFDASAYMRMYRCEE